MRDPHYYSTSRRLQRVVLNMQLFLVVLLICSVLTKIACQPEGNLRWDVAHPWLLLNTPVPGDSVSSDKHWVQLQGVLDKMQDTINIDSYIADDAIVGRLQFHNIVVGNWLDNIRPHYVSLSYAENSDYIVVGNFTIPQLLFSADFAYTSEPRGLSLQKPRALRTRKALDRKGSVHCALDHLGTGIAAHFQANGNVSVADLSLLPPAQSYVLVMDDIASVTATTGYAVPAWKDTIWLSVAHALHDYVRDFSLSVDQL